MSETVLPRADEDRSTVLRDQTTSWFHSLLPTVTLPRLRFLFHIPSLPSPPLMPALKVAVVGSGLAGLTSAFLVQTEAKRFGVDVEVHLFERVRSSCTRLSMHQSSDVAPTPPVRSGWLPRLPLLVPRDTFSSGVLGEPLRTCCFFLASQRESCLDLLDRRRSHAVLPGRCVLMLLRSARVRAAMG